MRFLNMAILHTCDSTKRVSARMENNFPILPKKLKKNPTNILNKQELSNDSKLDCYQCFVVEYEQVFKMSAMWQLRYFPLHFKPSS